MENLADRRIQLQSSRLCPPHGAPSAESARRPWCNGGNQRPVLSRNIAKEETANGRQGTRIKPLDQQPNEDQHSRRSEYPRGPH